MAKVLKKVNVAAYKKFSPATLQLPTGYRPVVTDVSRFKTLLWGREKIGKTTGGKSFPNAIFAATEPGTLGHEKLTEFNWENGGITSWEVFLRLVALLENKGGHTFKTVVIDTIDELYYRCAEYVCKEMKIAYLGETKSGKKDYGKSWQRVKRALTEAIYRLGNAGIGIVFVSHSKTETIEGADGEEYTKIFPSMASGARDVVHAVCDMLLYVDYMTTKEKKNIRVMITQGTELIWGGCRKGKFPPLIEVIDEDWYNLITKGFRGEAKPLDVTTLRPYSNTSAQFVQFWRDTVAQTGKEAVSGNKPVLKKIIKKLDQK